MTCFQHISYCNYKQKNNAPRALKTEWNTAQNAKTPRNLSHRIKHRAFFGTLRGVQKFGVRQQGILRGVLFRAKGILRGVLFRAKGILRGVWFRAKGILRGVLFCAKGHFARCFISC